MDTHESIAVADGTITRPFTSMTRGGCVRPPESSHNAGVKGGPAMNATSAGTCNDAAWDAILARDAGYDGRFVYAVSSTGVYCRPSCPSRRPRRANVAIFASPDAAERGGFRGCFRCTPRRTTSGPPWLAAACARLEGEEPVSLRALAGECGVSPFHLQRTFKRATGLSPRDYARARRAERLRALLPRASSVTEAVYAAGYGSSSRVYDGGSAELGMTPATYRRGGRGARIRYTTVATSLGRVLIAMTERGVCAVRFGDSRAVLEDELQREFPAAELSPLRGTRDAWVRSVVAMIEGRQPRTQLPLDVQATSFQRRVWEALRSIPRATVRSYAQIAIAVGAPSATRAVARACASNPIAVVVPCHRVVRSDGDAGGYRWGIERKRKLLAREERQRAGRRRSST
jgi:AraC family transcriptional regulator, regulatory protein of adaptative response / methylated-DNA-[protein]-cysteine methyltransferase